MPTPDAAPQRLPFVLRLFLWALTGIGVYALLGFLVLPPILKSVLTKQLSQRLHRETTIRDIHINPFLLTVRVNGLSLKDRSASQPFISFEELFLDLEAASVVKGGPVLKNIRVKAPYLTVVRNEDQTYNFSDLLEEFASKPAPDAKNPPKPLRFSLNNIQIEAGSIDFDDRPKHARHVVKDIALAIPFISNLPYYVDLYVQPSFHANVNGTPVGLSGKTKPFVDSLETTVDLNVTDFEIPKYLEYVPMEMRFKIVSGTLDSKLSLSFVQHRDKAPTLVITGKLALNQFAVTDLHNGALINLPLVAVGIDSLDVFSKILNLGTVLVKSPELFIRRDRNGVLNLASLAPENTAAVPEKTQTKEAASSTPLRIEAVEVLLTNGKFTLEDAAADTPFRTVLENVTVAVRHLSNTPQKATAIEASLTTDGGETLTHTGTVTLEPLAAQGTVDVNHLPLKRYAPYYRKQLLFTLEDGLLHLTTGYRYSGEKEGPLQLSGLTATLSGLRLKKNGAKEDFLKIPSLSIRNTDIDLIKRTVTVGELSTQKGTVAILRDSNGTMNLSNLVAPRPPAEKVAPPPPTASPATHWLVVLKKLTLDRYALKVEDRAASEPTTFIADPVSLSAENFSTARNTRGKISLRLTLNKTGVLSANGTVSIDPLYANLKLDLKGMDLTPLQPYFTDKVNLVVTSGALSTSGTLMVAVNQDRPMGISYSGDATLSNVATIDKAHSEDFIKWGSLAVTGLKAGTDPLRVEINDIALTDYFTRLIVNADGTLNVSSIVVAEGKTPEQPRPAAPQAAATAAPQPEVAKTIIINSVTMKGGSISFSDHYIQPNYSARLKEVGGKISGMSSEETQRADVDLRGKLENGSPLQITGKINPLGTDLFLDIKVDFKDIELSPLTPYFGKYAGYAIEKGKLSLNLTYLIEKRSLHAQNRIVLDQFTFGGPIESPTATKLPVRFAISLLKDRNGLIDLDLPVTGSLDDPQFSVWSLIGQVLTNLLTKAATSPFALLGSLVGGGQELSHVEFPYGQADLNGPAEDRLKTLAKILYERPALKIEVAGHVDTEKDREALRQEQFARKVKAQKLNALAKKGPTTATLTDIKVEPTEYTGYLALAYKKETFAKPRNFLGIAKDLEVPEMEKLILMNITVTEDDLRELALQRAQAVKDYLMNTKIEPQRIFLVSTSSVQDKGDKLTASRADFVIK
ncbi:MAG: DUF748 domain-containing protein [Nitrospirota bacterium]